MPDAAPPSVSPPDGSVPFRPVVLAPTFDNAATLAGVLDAVLATGLPLVVVNDGSADATAGVLADLLARCGDRVTVLTHPTNQGKAAALASGFARARDLGFTHAATIDTDAQHDPADLPALLALARQHPNALVLGMRDAATAGYPAANRLGRWASNTLVRWEGGGRLDDTQCGLRVYPLGPLTAIVAPSRRYGFETEILVRCAWAGVPAVEAPVRCAYAVAGGRVSHYRPALDTLRLAGLHVRLLTRALLRWMNPGPAWRAARQNPAERRRLSAALAAGVFVGNLPAYGLQTVLGVAIARRWRLQPVAVLLGTHVSIPPIGPLLIALAIGVGHVLLHGSWPGRADLDPNRLGYLALLRRVAAEWTLGSLVCGAVLAALTYAVARVVLGRWAVGNASGSLSRVLTGEG